MEQVPKELIRPVSGEIMALSNALQSPQIRSCHTDDIGKVLRYVMIKVGLRANNWPVPEEKAVLLQHIYDNYGGNRLEEIKVAFDLAVSGKLNLKRDDVKHYENFSCLYFSTIMNAYREWSAQEYHHVSKVQAPPEQKTYTDDELDQVARETAEIQYSAFLSGKVIFNSELNREILSKDGLLKEDELVKDFYKRMAGEERATIYA